MVVFENISALGGTTMAMTGMTIVFASLGLLSFFISRIHKVLHIWNLRAEYIEKIRMNFNPEKTEAVEEKKELLPSLKESAKNLKIISSFIGEPFHLSDLVKFAEKRGLVSPCPKSVVEDLVKESLIVKADEKRFCWNNKACDLLM